MKPKNSSSAQKDEQAKDATGTLERAAKGKRLLKVMAKSGLLRRTPNDTQSTQQPLMLQRRHTTSTEGSRYSRGPVGSMITENGEQKRFNRSLSLDDPRYHESKKQQPRSKHNITKTQRAVKPETVDEESATGWSLEWVLGQEWIQGIMAALEGCSPFPDAESAEEKGGNSEEHHSAMGYRVAQSGSLQFRKISGR